MVEEVAVAAAARPNILGVCFCVRESATQQNNVGVV